MVEDRHSEWMDNSLGLMHIEMLIVGNAQGLGILDVELIKEFPELKINSKLDEDRERKLRHITLSELWIMGAYELIRLINEIMNDIVARPSHIFNEATIKQIKETKKIFTEVRVPLVKFQKRHDKNLYSGVSTPYFDSVKGMGWRIHFMKKEGIETKIFYRKDLGDSLLELLKKLKEDTSAASNVARN